MTGIDTSPAVYTVPFSIGGQTWPGLAKVQEESGELGQVLGKIVATGGALKHWDPDFDPMKKVIEEAGDLYAALDYFLEASQVDLAAVHRRRTEKRKLFWAWHHEDTMKALIMEPPKPPEAWFFIRGLSFWPFDIRRRRGPWSERHMDDVYGNTPRWFKRLIGRL